MNSPIFKNISLVLTIVLLVTSEQLAFCEYDLASIAKVPGDVSYLGWSDHDEVSSGKISIIKGTSQVLRFERTVSRVAISDEEICDVQPLGKHEVLLYAKQPGRINLIVWDDQYSVASYEVQSKLDTSKLEEIIKTIDPKSDVEVVPFEKTVAVYGNVQAVSKIKLIEQAAASFDKGAMVYVKTAESKQILLEVRFAEIDRTSNEDFGVDIEGAYTNFYMRNLTGQTGAVSSEGGDADNIFGGNTDTIGYTPTGSNTSFAPLLTPASSDGTANLYGAFVEKDFMIQPFLEWLTQKNVLKIIARPNLVTKDGEEANFLVGGEFPVPIATADRITIDWKKFGTRLTFKPEVLENDLIRLDVKSSVSELDFTNTVTVSGTTVPTVLSRDHKTVAELKNKETLVIGGLLTQRANRVVKKAPFLANIPLLGKLFTKEVFEQKDVELLVVITPHLVKPFETSQTKDYYSPEHVIKATKVLHSAYPDTQGDAIREMIIQDEELEYFDDEAKKDAAKAKEVNETENSENSEDQKPVDKTFPEVVTLDTKVIEPPPAAPTQ